MIKKLKIIFLATILVIPLIVFVIPASAADYKITIYGWEIYAHDDHDVGTGTGEFFIRVELKLGKSMQGWKYGSQHDLGGGDTWGGSSTTQEIIISDKNINDGDYFRYSLVEKNGWIVDNIAKTGWIEVTGTSDTLRFVSEGTNQCFVTVHVVVTTT